MDAAVVFVVPAAQLGAWVVVWIGRRRVGWLYFVLAYGLAALSILVALLLLRAGTCQSGGVRTTDHEVLLCGPAKATVLLFSGYVGLGCATVLLILTLLVALVRVLVRAARRVTASEWADDGAGDWAGEWPDDGEPSA